MAISSWAGSLLYATSYLLFKALLSTGMTGESRLGESRIFCMAGAGAFKTPHLPSPHSSPKSKPTIFAELFSDRACSLLSNNENFMQSLSGFDFEQLNSYQ